MQRAVNATMHALYVFVRVDVLVQMQDRVHTLITERRRMQHDKMIRVHVRCQDRSTMHAVDAAAG